MLDAESVVGGLLKPGSVFAFLAAHRREVFPDGMFADLFPSGRGRPSVDRIGFRRQADGLPGSWDLRRMSGFDTSPIHR